MWEMICTVLANGKAVLAFIVAAVGSVRPFSVFFQTTYRIGEVVRITKNRPFYLLASLAFVVLGAAFNFSLIASVVVGVGFVAFVTAYAFCVQKTARRLTKKAVRLLVVYGVLLCAFSYFSAVFDCIYIAYAAQYPLLFLAKLLVFPTEKAIDLYYEKKAIAKLKAINPTVIAITGSCGKTTFKCMLKEILSTRYSVCASPASYNTPQGLVITVNEYLKADDEILVLEYGARKRGDIKKLCKLIPPDYCVLLTITGQHLETFGSQRNIVNEKFSIFNNGEKKGFFNGYDEVVKMLANSYGGAKAVSGRDCSCENVRIEKEDQIFDLVTKRGVMEVRCKLLADYVPQMLSLAYLVCRELKITDEQIKFAVNTLKPVAHRLQLLYNGNDVIIDDAYNSNEKGFVSAVNLLASFDKKKILITAGVVEMGKKQWEVNARLAAYAAQRVDYVLCYGVNARAIKSGGGDKVLVFVDLASCVNYYKTISGERVVLFENDLPDVY